MYIYIFYHDYIPSLHSKVPFVAIICHQIYLPQCPQFPHLKNNQVGLLVFFVDLYMLEVFALRDREGFPLFKQVT